MREIIFRGKHEGKWVYGSLLIVKPNEGILEPLHYYVCPLEISDMYRVDPSTVGQYTGLKDKNGKEIYEGDILHCWGGEYCQGYWEFDTKFAIKNLINDCFMLGESEFIEVIGNKWDNPELPKE